MDCACAGCRGAWLSTGPRTSTNPTASTACPRWEDKRCPAPCFPDLILLILLSNVKSPEVGSWLDTCQGCWGSIWGDADPVSPSLRVQKPGEALLASPGAGTAAEEPALGPGRPPTSSLGPRHAPRHTSGSPVNGLGRHWPHSEPSASRPHPEPAAALSRPRSHQWASRPPRAPRARSAGSTGWKGSPVRRDLPGRLVARETEAPPTKPMVLSKEQRWARRGCAMETQPLGALIPGAAGAEPGRSGRGSLPGAAQGQGAETPETTRFQGVQAPPRLASPS